MHVPLPRNRFVRLGLFLGVVAIAVVLVLWHGPDRAVVADAFQAVTWSWVAVAVGINLMSVAVRSSAWRVVILQAIPSPWPSARRWRSRQLSEWRCRRPRYAGAWQ